MITKEQEDDMLHALGRPTLRKNWKPITILDKCYRNRYITYQPEEKLQDLVNKGLMGVQTQNNLNKDGKLYCYYVTEKGVEILKSLSQTTDSKEP